ncbi:hypothetical protein Bbelb_159770 [Branchiostoma belcheri]|nr:hypothetical protein Bbelb_159770 [Branchiostoma belcheri]
MKLSVCLLFLGCLVLAVAAMPADREEDLQGLLTELEDLANELHVDVAEVGMDKRTNRQILCRRRCGSAANKCYRRCMGNLKRDEVEDLEAEEEELKKVQDQAAKAEDF